MIILLYGQDSYSITQYVNQLVARYQKKYPDSFNLYKFDLEENDLNEIRNATRETSFFKQVKFVVVKNPFAKPAFIEKVIKENGVGKQKETVLLLYQNGAEKDLKEKNQKIFDLLKKEAQLKEFRQPTLQAINKFAANYLAKHKISIKKGGLSKLMKETGSDFWRLKNELDKLIGLAKEENKKEIDENDLAKLINFRIDHNIFVITEAAFSNQSKALMLFEDYLSQGNDPLYLLSMIAYQLKNLLIIREMIDKNMQYTQIFKKTKMHPFFFKKNYETAKKYSLNDLKEIFQKAVDFEIAFKNGRAEAENMFFKIFL